jgi:molybdopterin-guanine dinucleotide biosynthesis protein A
LLVLAGGRGRRLGGVVKPLLRRADGQTLLAHALERFAPLVDDAYVVAPASMHSALGAIGACLEDPGEGPAAALFAAARAVNAKTLLLVGGDLVDPPVDVAKTLLAAVEGGARAAVGRHDGMQQSMISVFSRDALLAVDPMPRAMHRLLAALDATYVELDAPLIDVDAPDDVERYELEPP